MFTPMSGVHKQIETDVAARRPSSAGVQEVAPRLVSIKIYFKDKKLLEIPTKRPAYSDRMAYVMADRIWRTTNLKVQKVP